MRAGRVAKIDRVPSLESSSNPPPPLLASGIPARAPGAILVVDDHDLLRLGVRALIEAQTASSGASIEVFEAASAAEALALYEKHRE
ncbi:MAG: DNA-binding response regulator, partial [Variovorax paradoxus]|nr:DNA-binding response regulator [Variovorax paradoxus]